ncbi:hypothetical protein [Halorhabdus sp. SVX81]|uniref:hypothetical protein n=1 Tax=Halorhabdus sp. SVX81 TaxID=2978283 RepID=UPI0023DCD5CA|nr:hypothetical protein [Halorhabdus sp. SVX81]
MDRRECLGVIGAIGSLSIAGCSEELDNIVGGHDIEEVKENARSPRWEELYRNNSDWVGEPIHYADIRISDVSNTDGGFEMIIKHPDKDGFSGAEYLYCRWNGDPFQEGDNVDIWGVVEGLHTYNSLTGEQTVPEIDIVDIQLSN